MVDPHNSRSGPIIFSKFCTVKGAKKYVKIILMVYPKRFLFGANGFAMGIKMMHPYNSGSTLRIVYKFCMTKEAEWYTKIT